MTSAGASGPDTRALASVLQLNTDVASTIVDLPATRGRRDERLREELLAMAESLGALFGSRQYHSFDLRCPEPVFLVEPWAEPWVEPWSSEPHRQPPPCVPVGAPPLGPPPLLQCGPIVF